MDALARLLLAAAFLVAGPAAAQSQADPATPPDQPETIRVLLVGNSLTYTNNLPRLLQAVAASQPAGPRIETATYAAPGADLSQLWDDGHAAEALRDGEWDVLVLQERGGLLDCMNTNRQFPQCSRSVTAHREFTRLAQARGARVLLFMTSGMINAMVLNDHRLRKDAREILDSAYARLARQLGANGADVRVLPAAAVLLAPGNGEFDDAPFIDGVHPSVSSSLVIAADLYAAVTGRQPEARDLAIDFPLLPPAAAVRADAPIEIQPQLAGMPSHVLLKSEAVSPLYARAASD